MAEYQYIADRLLAYDNVRVFYFPDLEEIVTDLNNYADYTHYHRDINRYMTECFADGTCEITDSAQMSRALLRTRDMIERFDFEELFSVEWWERMISFQAAYIIYIFQDFLIRNYWQFWVVNVTMIRCEGSTFPKRSPHQRLGARVAPL